MARAHFFRQKLSYTSKFLAAIGATLLVVSSCDAQSKPEAKPRPESKPATQQPTNTPFAQEFDKYPGLLPEFGKLLEKLKQNVQFPPERRESRLLPLLPAGTVSYTAIPNYGDAVHQAVTIFRQELQESAVLNDWWQHSQMATGGPKLLDTLERLSRLHEYLGAEIVLSVSLENQKPSLLLLAEVRKPGLKQFLQESMTQLSSDAKQRPRVVDVQELAAAQDKGTSDNSIILVRPGFVVAGPNSATLRAFNASIEKGGLGFASAPLARRVQKEYEAGVSVLSAADLQKTLKQFPEMAKPDSNFQRSGFADVKYLVWDHKTVAGQALSEMELSFNAARHGSASWLAKPRPLNSLDFVSTKAMMAGTLVLTNPAQIFDDVKALASTPANTNPFPSITAFEQLFKISLKDDLLNSLGGELTVEVDRLPPSRPAWKALLSIRDANHLKKTLNILLQAAHLQPQHYEDDGFGYDVVRVPGDTVPEIGYAIVDGYLIVASSPEGIAEAVRVHRSGGSLAKSEKFLAALPPGRSLEASALLYQDSAKMSALSVRQVAPAMADSLAQVSGALAPTVVCLYGEDTAIREVGRSGTFDVGGALIVAAVAIPNLLRSRMAANEASAVGSVRSVNTAEVAYETTYPKRGFASDMAKLGIDPRAPKAVSPEHAALLDVSLANENCTGDAWCTKSGYQFRVKALCNVHLCQDYVTVAKPVDSNTGTRSFCSTSDGVIRYKMGSPLAAPVTASECKTWSPLK